MEVNERINYEMNRKGISQKELADKTNISTSVINRIVSGSRPIRDSEITQIAKILDVSTDYLLGVQPKSSINKEPIDLRQAIKDSAMTYGGKEISEHNLKVLEGIVSSLLGDDANGDE